MHEHFTEIHVILMIALTYKIHVHVKKQLACIKFIMNLFLEKGRALGCNMTLKSCLQNDTDLDKEVHFLVTTYL